MTRITTLQHEFVDLIPRELVDGVVYVSLKYATAVHNCCCGCGNKVVTPLSPTDWTLIFDGETISLDPSIGNWSYPCRSHYWIRHGRVRWSYQWTQSMIDRNRDSDRQQKKEFYRDSTNEPAARRRRRKSPWERLFRR